MTYPPISVVIATYHNPPKYSDREFVAECVATARAQTRSQPIEVVVVDGGSPCERSWRTCGLWKPDADITYSFHSNVGVCRTLRSGVEAASSEWLIPINADDQLAPHFVESAIEAAAVFQLRQLSVTNPIGVVVVSQQPLSAAIERDNYIPYLAMFARWFWDEMGGFVDVLGEGGACRLADWDLWIRVWQRYGASAPVAYVTDPSVIRIRNRPDSASKWSSDEFEALRARLWEARGIEP